MKPSRTVIHDRQAADLPINSQVSSIVVEDPYDPSARLRVLRSLRDDPVAAMHASRQLDEAQFAAARHWQRAYELAEVGGARAIDPTREAVDGGRMREPLSDAQCRALQELKRAAHALGMEGEAIVNDVLGAGLTVRDAATKRGLIDERGRRYLGQRFRECVETLAVVYGYVTRRQNLTPSGS